MSLKRARTSDSIDLLKQEDIRKEEGRVGSVAIIHQKKHNSGLLSRIVKNTFVEDVQLSWQLKA